jgi:hypothetical protein
MDAAGVFHVVGLARLSRFGPSSTRGSNGKLSNSWPSLRRSLNRRPLRSIAGLLLSWEARGRPGVLARRSSAHEVAIG